MYVCIMYHRSIKFGVVLFYLLCASENKWAGLCSSVPFFNSSIVSWDETEFVERKNVMNNYDGTSFTVKSRIVLLVMCDFFLCIIYILVCYLITNGTI
jgi:hypothetical protein